VLKDSGWSVVTLGITDVQAPASVAESLDQETLSSLSKGSEINLSGVFGFAPGKGKAVIALVELDRHEKYGLQLKTIKGQAVREEIPSDVDAIARYLARSVDGIGEKLAARIVKKFGKDTFRVLDEAPEQLKTVPGVPSVTDTKLEVIVNSWNADSMQRRLSSLLAPHGIGEAVANRIHVRHGAKSLEIVKANPYALTDIPGLGFKTVDLVARAGGIPEESPNRLMGAIEYVLSDVVTNSGETSITESALVEKAGELTSPAYAVRIRQLADRMVSARLLVSRELETADGSKTRCLTSTKLAAQERAIAKDLVRLSLSGTPATSFAADILERAKVAGAALKDAGQAQAVVNVFTDPVSVITGRPGCGKTTTTKTIVEVARSVGMKIVLCAPTGKAARRMTEAIGIKDLAAETVHATLGTWAQSKPDAENDPDSRSAPAKAEEGEGFRFNHNKFTPLEGDLFVVDEASMLDTSTAKGFLDAVPDGARVVFVGDSDQLPSVGAGNVLHDIMKSGNIPVSRLHKVHRTKEDSDIVKNAHAIINGDFRGINLKGDKDFRFTEADAGATADVLLETYAEMVERFGADEVQVLTARRGTSLGVIELNRALRAIANPVTPEKAAEPSLTVGGTEYRLGDRVIRTRTDRKLPSSTKELGARNGEVGVIVDIDPEAKTARIAFGDREVTHTREAMSDVELGYAITTHRSQGSEFAGLLMVVPRTHWFMLNRNLVYTGVTRARKEAHLIGDIACLKGAVGKLGSERLTGLAHEISTAFKASRAHAPDKPAAESPGEPSRRTVARFR
jgi:exodeoxyribonuclease V alpha subunit